MSSGVIRSTSNSHTSFRRGLKKPNRRIDWYCRNQAAGTQHEPKEKRNPPFWTATIPHTHPDRPDGRPTGECGTRPFWARPSRFASCNLRTGRQGPARPSPWHGDATPSDQAKASGRTGIGAIILPAADRPCGYEWSRPSNRAGGATHLYARRPPPTLRRDADPCQWTRRIDRNEAKPDLQSTKSHACGMETERIWRPSCLRKQADRPFPHSSRNNSRKMPFCCSFDGFHHQMLHQRQHKISQ